MIKISGILLILKFYFPYLIAISRDTKAQKMHFLTSSSPQLKLAKDMHLEYFPNFFLDVKTKLFFAASDCGW